MNPNDHPDSRCSTPLFGQNLGDQAAVLQYNTVVMPELSYKLFSTDEGILKKPQEQEELTSWLFQAS